MSGATPRSANEYPLIAEYNPMSPVSEAYRTLRTNIRFASVDRDISVVMITSTTSGEGKTTTLGNLAVTYALEGKRVLMIDGDLRKPMLHQVFGQSNRTGLTQVLTGRHELSEAVRETKISNLSLLTSGPIPPNPVEMLSSERMKLLIDECRKNYEVVLIDTPPVYGMADGQILASLCDGVLFVVLSGKTKREMVKKAKSNLEHVKANLLGVVLNSQTRSEMEAYSYYSYR